MPRMRMVKPDMRKSLTVSSWPIPVRWTFVGLICYVDDEGRGIDEVRLIKSELYPLDDDMTARKIDNHLGMLVDRGPLCRYIVDGKSYLHIISWEEHQKVSHPAPSRFPPCPTHDKPENDSGGRKSSSGSSPEASGNVPPRVRAGARGSGIRDQGSIAPDGAGSGNPRDRDELWDAIVEVCGMESTSLTKTAASMVGKVKRELAEVDATPNQVKVRANRYRQRYRDAELTPTALVKHWAALGDAVTPAAERPQDVYAALSSRRTP